MAEELTQETMLRAWKRRRGLTDPDAVKPWLFRIASNAWRDEIRRKKVRSRRHEQHRAPEARTAPIDLECAEDARRALAAIDELPERQRDVLYLTACEGLTPTQIGHVLDISAGAAKSTLSLARAKLRQRLEAEAATWP